MKFVLASIVFSSMAFGAAWEIENPHSSANFKIRHLMVTNVNGTFSEIKGTVNLEDDFTKTTAKAVIPVANINTAQPKRDEHLKSPDFFDVKKNPTIEFTSKKAVVENGSKKLIGDLKMHGVTKEVALDVSEISEPRQDFEGVMRRGMVLTTKLNRRDFGLNFSKILESGTVVVGDEVNVEVNLQLVPTKKAAAPAPAKKS